MERLDALDSHILWELDLDSRQSLSELSRKVRHGRDIVAYRFHRLLEKGVIRRASALVNPYAVGSLIYKSYVRLLNKPDRYEKLLSAVQKHPKVFCLAECDGYYDLIFNMLAQSPIEFSETRDALLAPFHSLIRDIETGIILQQRIFPRKYLKGRMSPGWCMGGNLDNQRIDQKESRLIWALTDNAFISLAELSEKLDTTAATVRRMTERLERKTIILGYRLDINRRALGQSAFKVQLELRPQGLERKEAFEKFCTEHPQIMSLMYQLGQPKVECNVESESYDAFHRVLEEIRLGFSDLIESINTVIVKEELYNRKLQPSDAGKREVSDQVESSLGVV